MSSDTATISFIILAGLGLIALAVVLWVVIGWRAVTIVDRHIAMPLAGGVESL